MGPAKHPTLLTARSNKGPLKMLGGLGTAVERAIYRRLGARLTSVTKKKIMAEMPIRDVHLNVDGRRVNGGLIMAFGDTLGAVGAMVNLPQGCRTATLESKTNFIAAAEGPVISGIAVPQHIGKTTMVWQTKVKDGRGRIVAIMTQTQIVLAPATAMAVRIYKDGQRRKQ